MNQLDTVTIPRRGLSAVTLWPVGVVPGASCVPGCSHALQPFACGVTSGPFQMVYGQQVVGFVTHSEDARAGWCLSVGGVRVATDPAPGMCYSDLPFCLFHTVAGLELTSDWAGCMVLEQVSVLASATLVAPAPARLVHGLTVLFTDPRCRRERLEFVERHGGRLDAALDLVPIQTPPRGPLTDVAVRYEGAGD